MKKTKEVYVTLDADRNKREALEALFALEPTPVPTTYENWEREYSSHKTKSAESD